MRRIARSANSVSKNDDTARRILGIDPSLTSTGFSYRIDDTPYTGTIQPGKLKGPARLYYIRERAQEVIEAARPDLIVMEDYAYSRGPKSGRVFNIGEGGGVLKLLFWEAGIDVMILSSTALKLAITGKGRLPKGNEGKQVMVRSIQKLLDYNIQQYDEADAFGLMAFGEAMINGRGPLLLRQRVRAAESPTMERGGKLKK